MEKKLKWLISEMEEWVSKGLISEEQASSLKKHYTTNETEGDDRLMMAFGIVAVVLIGIGIISVFAFNWGFIPRTGRVLISLIPLLIAQFFVVYTYQKGKSRVWAEVSSMGVGVALAASISLIAQTYQISGSFTGLMIMWMFLMLPIIYLMKSNYLAVLYLIVSIVWATNKQPFIFSTNIDFWVFGLLIIPYFIKVVKNSSNLVPIRLMSFAICLWSVISLGVILDKQIPGLWIISYSSLLWCFYEIGRRYFGEEKLLQNPFKLIGLWGVLIISFLLTFEWPWRGIVANTSNIEHGFLANPNTEGVVSFSGYFDFIIVAILLIPALYFLYRAIMERSSISIILGATPILSAIGFLFVGVLNFEYGITVTNIIFNLYIIILATSLILYGNKIRRLSFATLGLVWIMATALARFTDLNVNTLIKGIGFIVIGILFLIFNFLIAKSFKKGGQTHEEA